MERRGPAKKGVTGEELLLLAVLWALYQSRADKKLLLGVVYLLL